MRAWCVIQIPEPVLCGPGRWLPLSGVIWCDAEHVPVPSPLSGSWVCWVCCGESRHAAPVLREHARGGGDSRGHRCALNNYVLVWTSGWAELEPQRPLRLGEKGLGPSAASLRVCFWCGFPWRGGERGRAAVSAFETAGSLGTRWWLIFLCVAQACRRALGFLRITWKCSQACSWSGRRVPVLRGERV